MTSPKRTLNSVAGLLFLLAWTGLQAQIAVHPASPPSEVPPKPPQPICPVPEGPPEDPTYTLRAQAFDDINAGDAAGARHLMRCAIQDAPNDKIALRQEVYLDIDAGDSDSAIKDIDTLRALGAADAQLEAQEGYIYAEKKNYALAKAAFRRAIETGDSDIRFQSFAALRNLDPEGASRTVEFDIDSQYLDRFNDGIVDATTRLYQRIGADSPFRAYLNVRLLRDTASQVGKLPEIFDDNAFLTGVGLAFQPKEAHFAINAEANEAYVFYAGRNHTAALVPDFRATLGYYNVFRPSGHGHLSNRWSLEANGSIGFYSRYDRDGISYLQPQVGYDVVRTSSFRMAPYFQANMAFDTNQEYYNNIGEAIEGIEFYFHRLTGLALRTEYVRGYYLPIHTNTPNPYPTAYNDFRVRLTWSKSIPLTRGGE
jgi:tetratricopeptide (TPR) repeat protein